MLSFVTKPFQSKEPVPAAYRATFRYLYWDIGWFGILSGSALSFISIYATRLHATAFHLGLLNAGPALIGLFFTLPAGRWLHNRPVGGSVFWAALLARAGYLFWALLPALLKPEWQIWSYVLLVLFMTIPGTVLAVGFNALYASAVPIEWRGHVAGIRNAMFALIFIVTSLVSGYILDHAPLNLGHQIIFWLGVGGAAMSTLQLWHLRHVTGETVPGPAQIRGVIGDQARPGDMRGMGMAGLGGVALRAFARGTNLLRVEVLRGGYGKVIGALFFFHFAQFLPTSVFPLYWVNSLHLSDGAISIGSAIFNSAVLIGSLQISHLVKRWGNHTLMVLGVLLMSLHPFVTAFTTNLPAFLVASLIGGAAWSIVGGAVGNYLLEKVPNTDRPAYLAWYNLALNAAVLLGSLGGSWLAKEVDLSTALLISFCIRALAAYAIWRAE
ncbi:hypothetical protein BH10CHL1_BH10CHL1_41300 [soil metagenome]